MSDRTLRIIMIGFSLVGLGVASYLTYTHYAGINPVCSISHGCETVQHSAYSKVVGIPVALIGLIGYIGILATLFAPVNENTRLATLTLTIVGFGFSAYLTFREIATIHAICQWCVSSAIIMTILVVLAVIRYLRGDVPAAAATAREPQPAAQAGVGAR